MPVSLALVLTAGILIVCGVYLFLERTLTRVLLGFILTGNGVNLLFLVAAGPPGAAPFEGEAPPSEMSDPLPFAMVLTAIVITLGVSAFVIALAYRAWQLFGHDEVPDDVEDTRVLRRSRRRRASRREAVVRNAEHAAAEPDPAALGDGEHPGTTTGTDEHPDAALHAPGVTSLSEEHRHGALRASQAVASPAEDTGGRAAEPSEGGPAEDPDGDDDLGADLTSARDAPLDRTESDEEEAPPRRRRQRGVAR